MSSASPSMIQSFKDKAKNWARDVVALYNTPVPKELEGDKSALLKSAGKIKKSIETIFGTFDELESIGLGFFPLLIPAAVIIGATAAIYKWYTDFEKLKAKLAHHKMIMDAGSSSGEAADIIWDITQDKKKTPPKKALIMGALVIGAYFYFNRKG